jgi:hypothetical protein
LFLLPQPQPQLRQPQLQFHTLSRWLLRLMKG